MLGHLCWILIVCSDTFWWSTIFTWTWLCSHLPCHKPLLCFHSFQSTVASQVNVHAIFLSNQIPPSLEPHKMEPCLVTWGPWILSYFCVLLLVCSISDPQYHFKQNFIVWNYNCIFLPSPSSLQIHPHALPNYCLKNNVSFIPVICMPLYSNYLKTTRT